MIDYAAYKWQVRFVRGPYPTEDDLYFLSAVQEVWLRAHRKYGKPRATLVMVMLEAGHVKEVIALGSYDALRGLDKIARTTLGFGLYHNYEITFEPI